MIYCDIINKFVNSHDVIFDDYIDYRIYLYNELTPREQLKHTYHGIFHTNLQFLNLIYEINPKSILDIGCGENPFKSHFPNIIGIDPKHDNADYKMDFSSFLLDNEEWFDGIIAVNSLHFTDMDGIYSNILKIISILNVTGRVYFTMNPGAAANANAIVKEKDDFSNIEEIFDRFAEEKITHFLKKHQCIMLKYESSNKEPFSSRKKQVLGFPRRQQLPFMKALMENALNGGIRFCFEKIAD